MAEKAWVVAVSMGYGHERAAFHLRHLARFHRVMNADDYQGMPAADRLLWRETRRVYEFISRFKKVPLLGDVVFSFMDRTMAIRDFYPKEQEVETAGFHVRAVWALMEKKNWGRHFVKKLAEKPLPVIATYPIPLFMAEYFNYPGELVAVVTDADATRAWAPLVPKKTRIRYAATTERAAGRLAQYGVPERNISLTGFPLPESFSGQDGLLALKEDLRRRLVRLDPSRKYLARYSDVARRYLGRVPEIPGKKEPPAVIFAIGGAGAQEDIASGLLEYLEPLLRSGQIVLRVSAGTHARAADRLRKKAEDMKYERFQVEVLYEEREQEYFKSFDLAVEKSDILWTKPSELSFYAGLGIPLLLTPPIGSQEVRNQEWLLATGSAVAQLDIRYAAEWFKDFLDAGVFAECAMQGFIEMEKQGTRNIERLLRAL
ncbi:MAG: hypothetical protein HY482_02060 [Candidatus Wildermuthbacteria bacterium]|nr:hypothetical protein [Candidatus Wildermuthbacteria bacterium]